MHILFQSSLAFMTLASVSSRMGARSMIYKHILFTMTEGAANLIEYHCYDTVEQHCYDVNCDRYKYLLKYVFLEVFFIFSYCVCLTCPVDGQCQTKSIIYQSTVTRHDNNKEETYVGLTENTFKSRYDGHTCSFRKKIQKIQHSTKQLHMDPQRQQHRLHHQMEDS